MLQYGDVGYIKCYGVDHIILLCYFGLSHTHFLLVSMNMKLCGYIMVPGWHVELFGYWWCVYLHVVLFAVLPEQWVHCFSLTKSTQWFLISSLIITQSTRALKLFTKFAAFKGIWSFLILYSQEHTIWWYPKPGESSPFLHTLYFLRSILIFFPPVHV
jgi:hypothetical protein